jgi:hypothetical protein
MNQSADYIINPVGSHLGHSSNNNRGNMTSDPYEDEEG